MELKDKIYEVNKRAEERIHDVQRKADEATKAAEQKVKEAERKKFKAERQEIASLSKIHDKDAVEHIKNELGLGKRIKTIVREEGSEYEDEEEEKADKLPSIQHLSESKSSAAAE